MSASAAQTVEYCCGRFIFLHFYAKKKTLLNPDSHKKIGQKETWSQYIKKTWMFELVKSSNKFDFCYCGEVKTGVCRQQIAQTITNHKVFERNRWLKRAIKNWWTQLRKVIGVVLKASRFRCVFRHIAVVTLTEMIASYKLSFRFEGLINWSSNGAVEICAFFSPHLRSHKIITSTMVVMWSIGRYSLLRSLDHTSDVNAFPSEDNMNLSRR